MINKELFNKRVYAYLVDIVTIQVINLVLKFTFVNFVLHSMPFIPLKMQIHISESINLYSSATMLMIAFAYMTLFNYLNDGKTLGKYLIGLKTINKDNSDLTFKQCLTRAFSNCFSMTFASLPYLVAFFNKDQKTMSDFMAKTIVVEELKVKAQEISLTLLSSCNQVCSDEIYHDDAA